MSNRIRRPIRVEHPLEDIKLAGGEIRPWSDRAVRAKVQFTTRWQSAVIAEPSDQGPIYVNASDDEYQTHENES
jgi:hypothetical protein